MRRTEISTLHAALALVILTVVVFGPSVGYGFVHLDDDYLIYNNPAVQSLTWGNILYVFTHYDPQLYIPLTFLSYQLTALLFDMNATAFHVIDLLLHSINVILVLLLVRKLSGSLFTAAIAAALFAIHPIQTEAVMWAAARKDLLSGFFFLLSANAYLRYREEFSGNRYLIWSIALYALALLAKISIVLLPLWLLGIDWLQRREFGKRMIIEKIPYALLAVLFGIVAVIGKSRILEASGTLTNVLLIFKSAAFYVGKFFWPLGLSVGYNYTGGGQNLLANFGVDVVVVTLLIGLMFFLLFRRKRLAAFGIATYFVLLAPSFTTFWKNGTLFFASDRYVYLASVGIFTCIALALNALKNRMLNRGWSPLPLYGAVSVLLIALIPITEAQVAVWADTESLYRNNLHFYPDSVMVETNLGLELQQKGKREEARQHYLRAISLDVHAVEAYFNLSSLEAEEGHQDAADRLKLQIIDVLAADHLRSPADLEPLLWLVGRLYRMGRPDEAVRLLRKLIDLAPQFPEPLQLLQERGKIP